MSKVTVKTGSDKKSELIIANIIQTSADRRKGTIGDYKNAVQSAESVYYPNRAALYDLYTKVAIDGTYTGTWELKRVAQVLSKVIKFKASDKEVEEFDDLINSKKFRDFIRLRLQQKSHGLSGAEFRVGPVFDWSPIPIKHINPAIKKITKWQQGDEGWDYENNYNVMVFGTRDDFGFLLKITPLILYKQGNYGDWADFVEKYGSPFQVYEYDIYDDATRQQAFDLAKNAGSNLALVLPKQLNFRTVDGKQVNGDGKLQGNFNDALNKEITLTILGNLETTTAGGGSLAKAKIQALDQTDVVSMDMLDVLDTLNSEQFLTILESYGYNTKGGKFQYEVVADPNALKAEVDIDKFLVTEVKLPLADDYFYEKYGRPKPDNYDELKAIQEEKERVSLLPPGALGGGQGEDDPAQDDKPTPKSAPAGGNAKGAAKSPPAGPVRRGVGIKGGTLSFWEKIDLRIANFFAPGHKG